MATLDIYRGDDKTFTVTILNAAGMAQDLTGCTVWWTLKLNLDDADDDAMVKHYWTQAAESGLSRTHPTTGVVASLASGVLYNTISNTESDAFKPRSYAYDARLKDANARYSTTETGTLLVTEHATIRTTTP